MDLKSLQKAYKNCTNDTFATIQRQSTGILGLDVMMGGGLPMGRLIEVSGPESSSKTLLSLKIASAFQSRGQGVAMIDAERTTTENDLIRAGLDPKMGSFLYFMPRCGEEALDFAKDAASTGEISIVIIDSIPYIKPEKSLDKETGAATMADVARLIGSQMTQLTNAAYDNDCTFLFINQLRAKMTGYGGNDTCGGKALKYLYSVRLQTRVKEINKDGSGQTLEVKTIKSKVSRPFQTTLIDVAFADTNAVDEIGSLRCELQKLDWIQQKGPYYYLAEPLSEAIFGKKERLTLGQGSKKVRDFFLEHKKEYELLYEMAIAEISKKPVIVSATDEEDLLHTDSQ